jgi:5-hydroxyisourate hydrolase-like protein (transthyretin family)
MSRAIVIALFALLLQTPAAGRLTLQGRVVKVGTNDPVAQARIVVARVGGQLSDYRTGVADDGGRFAFRDLSAGTYRVYAEREDYLQSEYGRRTATAAGTPVVLSEGQPAPDIVIPLSLPGVITGRVMDRGKPARNVWVRLFRADYENRQRVLSRLDYAQTDDRGEYRIFGLVPGLYFINATPAQNPRVEGDTYVVSALASNANNNQSLVRTPGAAILAAGTLDPAAFDGDFFLPVFHPGTTDPAAATPLEVRSGATVSGVDLSVERTSAVHVRGRVLSGITGQPPTQNISVSLTGGRVSGPRSAGNVFDLAGVPPGDYILIAQTTTSDNRLFGAIPLTIADQDIENLTVTVTPGTTLQGRLTVEGRAPNDPEVARYLVELEETPGTPSFNPVRVQSDGTFTVTNVTDGEYGFSVERSGTSTTPFAKAARYGSDNVLDAPIRVRNDGANRILEITVSLNTAVLDLRILDDAQRPASGVTVAAVPEPGRRHRSELYRTAVSDAEGRVRLDGMIPGEYKLFASAEVGPRAWQDPDVIRRYESRGTTVRLSEGAMQDVSLRVLQ